MPAAGTDSRSTSTHSIRHLEYVFNAGEVDVYDIDHDNSFVRKLRLPQVGRVVGVVASPVTSTLYVAYTSTAGVGSMLAYDLRRDRIIWRRVYRYLDSMAISPNGRRIYMPAGENSGSGKWYVLSASTGAAVGSIDAGSGAHNTIMGPDGKYVYLGGVDFPYLDVASTASNQVVKRIGPLNPPGVRPFTINGSQTLAFTTSRSFLGFQVSSIKTGKVLYSVAPPGFSFNPATFGRTPDHGISLSPDERELYLIDTPNGYVHVFDVSGLPGTPPHDISDIRLAHPPPNDGWLQHSRDGHYVYVGRAGDVIDTRLRKVVAFLPPLQNTADFLEIDWQGGRPVAATSRYGVGYARSR
jgi:DNA-binding beta-propeller fold protein YncE